MFGLGEQVKAKRNCKSLLVLERKNFQSFEHKQNVFKDREFSPKRKK